MKRSISLLIALTTFIAFFAQTQQGIVKTRGRMVNGQLVSGVRLSGATITLNIGNPLVSGDNGAFSFNVPSGKNFSLVSAQKQGYTLADPEYTNRSFAYSGNNPFYVVLEDEAQRQADVNAATRKVRRTLTAQLQAREDEIEALKEQNKLTEAEYQRRLQELYDNQSKSEQLVKEMAERYASTDYDQLDEFNRLVQMYIEEGELQKADSMISKKGSMDERSKELDRVRLENAREKEELARRQKNLQQSVNLATKLLEDFAKDSYFKYEICKSQNKTDSAVYWLELRAQKDTLNVKWQLEAGKYIENYAKNYEKAMAYFNNSLITAKKIYGENNIHVALSYEGKGRIFSKTGEFALAIQNMLCAEKIITDIKADSLLYLSILYRDIADLFERKKDYSKAITYYNKEIEIQEKHVTYDNALLAPTYTAIGRSYYYLKEYDSAIANHLKALEGFGPNYVLSAFIYRDLGNAYKAKGNYVQALENYKKAFSIDFGCWGTKTPYVIEDYIKIGEIYFLLEDYNTSVSCLFSALSLINAIGDQAHLLAANVNSMIGRSLFRLGDYTKALMQYKKALEILEEQKNKDHSLIEVINNYVADVYLTSFNKNLKLEGFDDYFSSRCFTLETIEGNTPAKTKGMNGEYIVLAFANWNINSTLNLFEVISVPLKSGRS